MHPQAEETDERWALGQDERALLANKSSATRLGFGVLLKMFQAEGRFPRGIEDVLAPAMDAIARPRACRSIRPLPRSRPASSCSRASEKTHFRYWAVRDKDVGPPHLPAPGCCSTQPSHNSQRLEHGGKNNAN